MKERHHASKFSMFLRVFSAAAFFVFVALTGPTSLAAAEQENDKWQFRIAPYIWAVSLDGTATVGDNTADVDASFSDILKDLNGGIMLLTEARRGPVSIFGDTIYAALETKNSSGPFSIKTDLDLLVFNFGIAYEAAKVRLNSYDEAPIWLSVEPIFGGRLFYMDTKLDPERLPSTSSSKTWVDPVVGLRLSSDITANWNFMALGDIGGFGVSSDLTWQAMAVAGYRFGLFGEKDANAMFGYRAIYDDFETGSGSNRFGIDATFHGPILGLEIKF